MTPRVTLIQRTEEGSLRRIIRGGGHEAVFVFVYGLRSQEKIRPSTSFWRRCQPSCRAREKEARRVRLAVAQSSLGGMIE